MARVPTYDNLQETERALPGVRQESIATPALLDAGAEQTIALGKGVEAAGTGLAQVAYHMQQRENADVLFTNEANDKAAYLAYEADLRAKRQGNAAKGAAADTGTWWKDRISKNLEGMTGEQKRLYTQRITPVQLSAIHSVSQFEAHQMEIAHDASWTADKHNTINLAAATPTPGVIGVSIAEIKRFNSYQGARKGWDAQVLQAVNGDDITKLHKQAIQTIAKDDPGKAAAYFKEHEQEINGTERAEIGAFAEKATAARVGADTAQQVWQTEGPKGDNDASNIDKMKAAIREKLKDNPFARDAALHEISQIDADRDKAIRARDANRTAQVNTMLMSGKSIAAVMQTPAWAALDGTEQRKILLHEEQVGSAREGRAAARESRAYTADVRAQHQLNEAGLATMLKLSLDPQALYDMSADDLVNQRTKIGDENVKKLADLKRSYMKDPLGFAGVKMESDTFKEFALKAGLDPTVTAAKNPAVAKRVIEVHDRINIILEIEKKANKGRLPPERVREIMQREIDTKVLETHWYGDKPISAIAIPGGKEADYTVEVPVSRGRVMGSEKVPLASIPPAYQIEAASRMKARGIPYTPQNLAKYWLADKAVWAAPKK